MTHTLRIRAMRTHAAAGLLGLTVFLAGCGNFDAPDQNASTLSDLTAGTPTKVALAAAAQGLIGSVNGTNSGLRGIFGANASTLGIMGHESYNLDVSNPQNIPTFYSPAGGNSFKNLTTWVGPYATMAQANIIIAAADKALGLTAGEREAVKGFSQTVKAFELFWVIRQTDLSGAVADALADPTADPPPIVSRAQIYTRILQLLDSASGHLTTAGAGTAFPFTMTDGFASFNTAGTFAGLTKGLRAKVGITQVTSTDAAGVQTAAYTQALTDLATSFLDTTKAMSFGAYHTFSTLSGDVQNGQYDPSARQRYADSSFYIAAQLKAVGGARDDRYTSKIDTLTPNVARYGFNARYRFRIYNSNTAPAAILKNEDLILLRAEAEIGLGQNSNAARDINVVRVHSGGLPPISDPYVAVAGLKQPAGTLLDELLYERQFSLMYENGDRWVDLRRYGRQNQLLPERSGDVVWSYMMIPINECLPRTPQPSGCTVYPPHFP